MQTRQLFDFRDAPVVRSWRTVDDVVMGGRSRSVFESRDFGALFEGEISFENNGGFASVRSLPAAFDLGEQTGIELDLVGDGRRYKFNVRLDANFDGVTYQTTFVAPNEPTLVRLPFAALEPTWRGRPVDAEPFDPTRITTFGILVGERQGHFRLQVASLAAYRDDR